MRQRYVLKGPEGKHWTAEDDAASVGGRGMRTRRVLAGEKRLHLRAEPPRLGGIQRPPAGFC